MDNRPEGRKKRIEGAGGGLYRRGEGQNTGPVGSGGPGPGNGGAQRGGTPFVQTGGGGNYRGGGMPAGGPPMGGGGMPMGMPPM